MKLFRVTISAVFIAFGSASAYGQSVCLPLPRLLTTMPMGGRVGTQVEIAVTSEFTDDSSEIHFSHSGLTAVPRIDGTGLQETDTFLVTIAADVPPGLYEARMMTRLGISSSRIFSVGVLTEVVRKNPNLSPATAMPLELNSVCNATTTPLAVDFYTFEARKGQRIVCQCAAGGIDSKLKPVLILADSAGRELFVERRGGMLDFVAPSDGTYSLKLHDLLFQGGPAYFYRLVLEDLLPEVVAQKHPSTLAVNAFSWPPMNLPADSAIKEIEPNTLHSQAQKISLPCDLAGNFFPAADVDTFEFTAMQGDVWWVEVASERLGVPTDPSILVQKITGEADTEQRSDVAEFSDIPSPLKPSSNGYSYDGPPYEAGSADILGKLEIKETGTYRLQLRDLFGGTRSDPRNIYRLIIRKASPDFAVVAWSLHMELRNGDRSALSKPIALRGGSTVAIEVVAIRRDGFDGEIQLVLDGLPEGVIASGLTIPKNMSRGIMLVTAKENAPRSLHNASFTGRATLDGVTFSRPCRLASMAWPVRDASQEIPSPRLLVDVPVSVSGVELAPLSLAASKSDIVECTAGEKLTIPLTLTRRGEFSGTIMQLKTLGNGFEQSPGFDVPLTSDTCQAVIDLEKMKTSPGDYTIAFYGTAVSKYQYNPTFVSATEKERMKAQDEATTRAVEAKDLIEKASAASAQTKEIAQKAAESAAAREKLASAALAKAVQRAKKASEQAQPSDIADIIVSQPIVIRVLPALIAPEKKP